MDAIQMVYKTENEFDFSREESSITKNVDLWTSFVTLEHAGKVSFSYIWNQDCWNLKGSIKVVDKIEFRISRSESYINKARNTVLSKPIGRTKTVVKYKNGVFLYSRYNDVSDGNIED